MDLEKTEELTVSKVKRTLSVILEYANSLALTDLEGNRDKLMEWHNTIVSKDMKQTVMTLS